MDTWGGACAVLNRRRSSCDEYFCSVPRSPPFGDWAAASRMRSAVGSRLGKRLLEIAMKRRILLVDDELPILLTLKAILEMNGFEVETAASAREAEQKLNHGTYEMVITDMCMERQTRALK